MGRQLEGFGFQTAGVRYGVQSTGREKDALIRGWTSLCRRGRNHEGHLFPHCVTNPIWDSGAKIRWMEIMICDSLLHLLVSCLHPVLAHCFPWRSILDPSWYVCLNIGHPMATSCVCLCLVFPGSIEGRKRHHLLSVTLDVVKQ